MVLASVYLSVSASLPTTSDIKPVEVWLLFNLAYPFLVILVNVLLQVNISFIDQYSSIKHMQTLKKQENKVNNNKYSKM